ncbi:protein of unknown function DUF2750 [Gottschalkia purinilytica]|uniref:DUF2750 domain-containing protein n=1 Tax=Gottschalkia purinilytica TaxID=1503 RepID=A0A0L0W9F4_GOTPU|nr:DUF2750 domain-containing protein [Gottschalkia purinilytica]KNF08174.1 protein of unknown function DUF2750 [Gottschalkia purinilytica]
MNIKEFESVLKLPRAKRYSYFIKKVVDYEEVWGLYDDGWAVSEDDDGNMLLPLWPRKEFAEFCAKHEWENYKPKKIDLYEFMNDWLPAMKEDSLKPSIFFNNIDSIKLEIDTLLNDLNLELEDY